MVKTTRADIVTAAGELFREKGYDATTLADIAGRVGVLKGSLYHHISSKEELLAEVAGPPIARMVTELEAINAQHGSPTDRLRAVINMHLQHLDEDYPHIFVYLQERFGHDAGDIATMSRRYQRLVRTIVEEGVAAGDFRDDLEPNLVVFAVIGACNWLHKWYQPGSDWDLGQIQHVFATLILTGLQPR